MYVYPIICFQDILVGALRHSHGTCSDAPCRHPVWQAYWAHGTQLQLKSHGDYVEYNLNYPYRDAPAQKEDLGVDNPVYAGDLTKKQQQNCVSLHYGCLDQISEDLD